MCITSTLGNQIISSVSHLMEVIELYPSHSSTDSGGNGLTGITNKVRNREDLRGLLLILLVTDLKMPESANYNIIYHARSCVEYGNMDISNHTCMYM